MISAVLSGHTFGEMDAQLLQSVQQAANAAAAAAQAMREANEKRVTGFGEASKVVQCPKEFGTSSSVEDQTQWFDFAFSFKQWFFLADGSYDTDLRYVEANPNTPVNVQDNVVGQASKERSKRLYSVLAGILRNLESPSSNWRSQWFGSLQTAA